MQLTGPRKVVYFRLSASIDDTVRTTTRVIYGEGHLSTEANVPLLAHIFLKLLAFLPKNLRI
jgi:hypothetical protein